jgi:hypothetical protein
MPWLSLSGYSGVRLRKRSLAACKKNETLPPGHKVIQGCWVFHLKTLADGTPECYKAQWVAKGFLQVKFVDYSETFAPVARLENFHTFLALAVALDLEIHQMDVESAFLQAPLIEEVYMEQPEKDVWAETSPI